MWGRLAACGGFAIRLFSCNPIGAIARTLQMTTSRGRERSRFIASPLNRDHRERRISGRHHPRQPRADAGYAAEEEKCNQLHQDYVSI